MISRRNFVVGSVAGCALLPQAAFASVGYVPDERFIPRFVKIRKGFEPGEIVILPSSHYLYLIVEPRMAIRYGVASGKQGLAFYGDAVIERKVKWPSWKPTADMIRRNPKYKKYEDGMPGGPANPLGARAMYFYQNGRDTMIRIHGTTQPQSIGQAVSNGCFRMINEHVADLYERVPLGTKVTVLRG